MNVLYYTRHFLYNALPPIFFKKKYEKLRTLEKTFDPVAIEKRLAYYMKIDWAFEVPLAAVAVKDYKRKGRTTYFLDLKEFLHYFSKETRFAYRFGDYVDVLPYPTLYKARPIKGPNENSVLFKLNKKRHFRWANDPHAFAEKQPLLVWRGGAYHRLRQDFVKRFYNHPLCNVGQTNKPVEQVPWQKPFLSIAEQLKYKFIFCPEGNDVATNLKWAMSSNSLCIMPKPRFETWFMEGTLEAGKHYIEVKRDYSDLEEKIVYFTENTDEAVGIIHQAHQHVQQFQDKGLEDVLCLKVLERYAQLSGQTGALRFE